MTEIKPGTPLPWSAGTPDGYTANTIFSDDAAVASVFGVPMNTRVDEVGDHPRWAEGMANARYIAHACNAYPSVVTGLREAREALGACRSILHYLFETSDDHVAQKARGGFDIATATLAHLDTLLAGDKS